MSLESFALPREATIQLNDVYGPQPVDGLMIPPPEDFDAVLTSQVRNTGRFHDGEFALSNGGSLLGGYGAVLVDDLRARQRGQAHEVFADLGVENITELSPEQLAAIHPDNKVRLNSLNTAVVAVVNEAARTAEHHRTGRNGADFYVATTRNAVEIYAQAPFLSGLDARGRITSLHRIPDGAIWPKGEQYRSSVASDARRKPQVLDPVGRDKNWPIPPLPDGIQMAFTDKFGNVRLQTSDVSRHSKVMQETDEIDLVLDEGRVAIGGIKVVADITEIPEGKVGIYVNPADPDASSGPAYFELMRRVSDPNGDTEPRAYHVLTERVGTLLGHKIRLSDWNNIVMDVIPSTPSSP